jgi:hypothetical protein
MQIFGVKLGDNTLTARLYSDKYGFKTNPRGTVGKF